MKFYRIRRYAILIPSLFWIVAFLPRYSALADESYESDRGYREPAVVGSAVFEPTVTDEDDPSDVENSGDDESTDLNGSRDQAARAEPSGEPPVNANPQLHTD